MNKRTLVSVIITTRNNQDTLGACLESLTKQKYYHVEIIVIDNNSTDKTKQIAKKYTKRVFNKGPERSAQRNYGVRKSSGDYIFIVDSDMELPPKVIGECVAVIKKYTQAIIIPEVSFGEGFWARCKALERSFYNGVDWIEAPRFFSKKIYKVAGGYDEDLSGGEDWDLGNRVRNMTKIGRTITPIWHNEGKPTLISIIRKQRYYAKGFKDYYQKEQTQTNNRSPAKQVMGVYGLFLSRPIHLFKEPEIGLGMLTMKTIEFGTMLASSRYLNNLIRN